MEPPDGMEGPPVNLSGRDSLIQMRLRTQGGRQIISVFQEEAISAASRACPRIRIGGCGMKQRGKVESWVTRR